MYTPKFFEESRIEVLHDLIRRNSFAMLVTSQPELVATHVPFLIDASRGQFGMLRGHLARANGQWNALDGISEVMVAFQGPHAYVSPSWYQTKLSVPTWNYAAVHAYGKPRIITDAVEFRSLLEDLVDANESRFEKPWNMDVLPDAFVAQLQIQIVGFEIEITRLEGKFKLSQNRPPADRLGVIAGLESTGDPMDAILAALMKEPQ